MSEFKKRILLVEDEPNLAFNLEFNLQEEGFEVTHAVDGLIAIEKYTHQGPFDLVVLDVMLPEINGFEVARHIRERDDLTQILMLTALGREEDRLRGFEAGVDDYITKPFNLKEFILRVKRMIRRTQYFVQETPFNSGRVVKIGPFELNVESLQLTSPTGLHSLTALETDILKEFMSNPSRVLTREHLLEKVWGMRGDIETRTVDNFIVRLRKYIEPNPSEPRFLTSVRGRGYRFMKD
jgi:two-component system alkaline phosphatase synthesis response regulator PhoP